MGEEVLLESGRVWREGGVLRFEQSVATLDLDAARNHIEVMVQMAAEQPPPRLVLIDPGPLAHMTRDARRYVSEQSAKSFDRLAVVVRNPVQRMIATFVQRVSPVTIPMRPVPSPEAGIAWLLQEED